jgi:hypothetical protein
MLLWQGAVDDARKNAAPARSPEETRRPSALGGKDQAWT